MSAENGAGDPTGQRTASPDRRRAQLLAELAALDGEAAARGLAPSPRDELAPQRAALRTARDGVADALTAVAAESRRLAKLYAGSSRQLPDASAWAGLVSAARRAEEVADLAALDLATAGGEDA